MRQINFTTFPNDALCGPVRSPLFTENIEKNENTGVLFLELTNRCNLKCRHCYSSAGNSTQEDEQTLNDWKNVISDHALAGVQNIQFTGGEPTLSPYLFELVEFSRELGIKNIEVFTNGTRFSEQFLDFVKENDVNLAFSLYSQESRVHDDVTGVAGSYEKTVASIKKAVSLNITTRIGVVLFEDMEQNPTEINRFLEGLGVFDISFDKVRNTGRGSSFAFAEESRCIGTGCCAGNVCVGTDGEMSGCVFDR